MRILSAVSLLCFLLPFAIVSAQQPPAQEPTPEQLQRQFERQLRNLTSPRQQVHWEADQLVATRSVWNGQGTWMPLRMMMRIGGEAELGLTDAQKERLAFLYLDNNIARGLQHRISPDSPDVIQGMEAIKAAQLPDDPFFEHATEEQKNALREATIASLSIFPKVMLEEIEETLTPEQMLAVRKLEMQLMPEMGIPFPSMFDPLDLTEEQKKEMNRIADEMKAEFDRLTMDEAALKGERLVAAYGLLKDKTFTSREEFQKAQQDIHRQFVPSEAMRKRSEELRERGTKFVSLLQTRLMTVLTDEQLDKMGQILDETPEAVKKVLAQMKAAREAQAKSPVYTPGPDSWRPGMPMPVEFKEERRGNFPRPQNVK